MYVIDLNIYTMLYHMKRLIRVWQVMTAKAKAPLCLIQGSRLEAVDFGSLAEALGANASEVGEKMAMVRPSGGIWL